MNLNQKIKDNSAVVGVGLFVFVAIMVFAYLMFAPDRNAVDRTDQASFLIDDGTGIVNDGNNLGASVPPVAVQPPAQSSGEAIQWCVLLDGANHIPDLFGEGIPNGGGGTNWHSNGAQDPKGPHGVFNENGKMVFFVKKSYLDQNGASPMSAQLKSNVTGWNNPLPMTWANVGGEQALVYVK